MALDVNAPIPGDPYGRTPASFGFQVATNPQTGQQSFYLPGSEIVNIGTMAGAPLDVGGPMGWYGQIQNADPSLGWTSTTDPMQALTGWLRQYRDISVSPTYDPSGGGAFIDPASLGYAERLPTFNESGNLGIFLQGLIQSPIGAAAGAAAAPYISEALGFGGVPTGEGVATTAAGDIGAGDFIRVGENVTEPIVTASGEPLADVGKTIAETGADLGYTPAPTDVGLSEQAGLQYFPQAAGTAAGAGGLAAALKSYAPLISALTGVGGLGLGAYQASKAGQQGRQAAAQIAQLPSAQQLPVIAQQAQQAAATAAQTGQLPPGQQAQYQQLSRDAIERAKALSRRAGIADSSTATALQTQAETAATNAQQAALQNYINQQTSLALSALTGSNTPLMAAIQAQMTADANSAALMQRYFATGGQLLTSAMSPTYYPYGYSPAATPIQ